MKAYIVLGPKKLEDETVVIADSLRDAKQAVAKDGGWSAKDVYLSPVRVIMKIPKRFRNEKARKA